MSNANEKPNTEGEGNAIGSTTTNPDANASKKRKQYKERSDVWNHFTKFSDENGKPRARCFDRFSEENLVYIRDLKEGPGVPNSKDWGNVRRLGGFLRYFYELTLRVSGTKYITSNSYLDSISCIDSVLKKCRVTDDIELKDMTLRMSAKFDKYWGDVKKFNLLVFIASVFDPRTKLVYLKVTLREMYGDEIGDYVWVLCTTALTDLFNDYKRIYGDQHGRKAASSSSSQPNDSSFVMKGFEEMDFFSNSGDTLKALRERNLAEAKRQKAELGEGKDMKSELERYLIEDIEGDDDWFEYHDFSVLGWWKKRSPAFPILSLVARDVLEIPISTVASEYTFSTGGRVLDSFRSSLTPQTVEALICCQDWIRSSDKHVDVEEHIEDLEKFEDEMKNMAIS